MASNNSELEQRLWEAADELRANSRLRSHEYSVPVLGLVFLKWADYKFEQAKKELEKKKGSSRRRREIGKIDYQAKGVMYLPDESRYSYLLKLPESADIGKAINDAMEMIEEENEDLRGVLPATYHKFDGRVLYSLLRIFNSIPMDVEGDVFGKVYEYFLGKFAAAEGQKGGEFFTPTSIVKLIVEILEPYHGRIYDPACGSGGMFVQSAKFVERHRKNPSEEISIYGQERVSQTVRICKMNLAVHGLAGDIREGNTYYDDIHSSVGRFGFVMANPPFNVDRVDKERIKDDPRFKLGIPSVDNANYLWIQVFYEALSDVGRAGFVMANSACDARDSEKDIREKMMERDVVDIMISVSPNFFYTVSLPCMLWFLDKAKRGSDREGKVLFIDAREIYRQIDRAHRDLSQEQIEFISNIVRLYRGQTTDVISGSKKLFKRYFGTCEPATYRDIPGLCKVVETSRIRKENWSLNPGRYVGTREIERDEIDFGSALESLQEEFEELCGDARELEERVSEGLDRVSGQTK